MKRLVLVMMAAGLLLSLQPAQAQWMTAKRLTTTSGNSDHPSLAVDTYGNLHLVWHDDTPGKL
jgi:hypothetical protein